MNRKLDVSWVGVCLYGHTAYHEATSPAVPGSIFTVNSGSAAARRLWARPLRCWNGPAVGIDRHHSQAAEHQPDASDEHHDDEGDEGDDDEGGDEAGVDGAGVGIGSVVVKWVLKVQPTAV